MDTTKFDAKMAELRAEEIAKTKPVGRPKGPEKVVYKRRVPDGLVEKLDDVLRSSGLAAPVYRVPSEDGSEVKVSEAERVEVEDLKRQLKIVLDDNERLTNDLTATEARLQRVARLTDSEKLILWIRKYDELKKVYDLRVGGTEHSQ